MENEQITAVKIEEKRVRRSPAEARAARLKREQNLAAKATVRLERLRKQTEQAQARASKALERSQQIEANVPSARVREEIPIIGENVAKRIQRELTKSLKEIGTKHNIDFGDLTPRLTQHGAALSLRIVAHVAGAAKAVKKAVGATREATRFLENHKLVGIKPTLLGKEVQLAGEEGNYKVLGMKGRAHDIVLQKVGSDEAAKTIPADEFKTRMVGAT